MRKQRKPDIRREDCHTEEQKLAYSRQQYDRWQTVGYGKPSEMVDPERFPLESEPWHGPEYWIAMAKSERERKRLQRKLLKNDDR